MEFEKLHMQRRELIFVLPEIMKSYTEPTVQNVVSFANLEPDGDLELKLIA